MHVELFPKLPDLEGFNTLKGRPSWRANDPLMLKQPTIPCLLTIGTWAIDVDAIPDTGFEGGLVVPVSLEADILAEPDYKLVRLADSSVCNAPHWPAEIEIEGHHFSIEAVGLGQQFLIGREVMDLFRICFEYGQQLSLSFRDGGAVTLPNASG